ncbi:ROK family transcriptional regulator [Arthrobacter cryoconiti]
MEHTANTPQQLRRANMATILAVLRRSGAANGTDLIDATGLARATVIAVCDDLIKAGWVQELPAQKPSTGVQKGRPARVFEFDARAGFVVGLDIGMAKTTAVVADLKGAILAKNTVAFAAMGVRADSPAPRFTVIDQAICAALADAGAVPGEVLAAGVGIAAPVDRAGNIPSGQPMWKTFDTGIKDELQRRHGWPVLMGNDANLAALAEAWMGVGAGVQDLAVMLAGERIGFGLMESGRLLRGARGRAGEVGSLELLDGVGTPDGIARLARDLGAQTETAELTQFPSAEQVFDAAARGDAAAAKILTTIAVRLGRVIAVVATFTDPELVVIGGAVAASSAVLLEALEAELANFLPSPPRVAVSPLGDSIVSLGAVRLALDHVQEHVLELVPGGGGMRGRNSRQME